MGASGDEGEEGRPEVRRTCTHQSSIQNLAGAIAVNMADALMEAVLGLICRPFCIGGPTGRG